MKKRKTTRNPSDVESWRIRVLSLLSPPEQAAIALADTDWCCFVSHLREFQTNLMSPNLMSRGSEDNFDGSVGMASLVYRGHKLRLVGDWANPQRPNLEAALAILGIRSIRKLMTRAEKEAQRLRFREGKRT